MKKLCILLFLCLSTLAQAQLPDLIPYRKGDKWGYCDSTKKIIIPVQFEEASLFNKDDKNMFFAYVNYKGVKKMIDKKGNLSEIAQKEVSEEFINEVTMEEASIDKSDMPSLYELGNHQNPDYTLYLVKNKDTKLYGFLDKKFNEVIPCIYEIARSFDEYSIASVSLNDKWGVINDKGEIIIPIQYEDTKCDRGINIRIQKDGKWGIMNINNQVVLDIKYQRIENTSRSNDIFIVKLDDKWGIVEKGNKILGNFIYDFAMDNYFSIALRKNDKWGIYDIKEKIVIPCKYDKKFDTFENGLTKVYFEEKEGYIDIYGTEYWKK